MISSGNSGSGNSSRYAGTSATGSVNRKGTVLGNGADMSGIKDFPMPMPGGAGLGSAVEGTIGRGIVSAVSRGIGRGIGRGAANVVTSVGRGINPAASNVVARSTGTGVATIGKGVARATRAIQAPMATPVIPNASTALTVGGRAAAAGIAAGALAGTGVGIALNNAISNDKNRNAASTSKTTNSNVKPTPKPNIGAAPKGGKSNALEGNRNTLAYYQAEAKKMGKTGKAVSNYAYTKLKAKKRGNTGRTESTREISSQR